MSRSAQIVQRLLGAATELAEARRHDSDTCEEWDALERAITAAEESTDPSYAFEGDRFIRRSTLTGGSERLDAIDVEDIDIIAQTIEEDADPHGNGWFVVDELVAPSGRTWTRCLVAVECLKHLGMLRERALDNRLSKTEGFGADAAVAASKRETGLPST